MYLVRERVGYSLHGQISDTCTTRTIIPPIIIHPLNIINAESDSKTPNSSCIINLMNR